MGSLLISQARLHLVCPAFLRTPHERDVAGGMFRFVRQASKLIDLTYWYLGESHRVSKSSQWIDQISRTAENLGNRGELHLLPKREVAHHGQNAGRN